MKEFTEKTDSAIEYIAKDETMRKALNAAIYGGNATLFEYMASVRTMGESYVQHEMQGRKKQLSVIAEVYALWATLERSENNKAFDAIKKQVADAYKVQFKQDVQSSAIVLRYAFSEIEDKQVSVIGRVMRYCLAKDVTYDGFAAYVSASGGLEGVRKLAVKADAAEQAAANEGNASETTIGDLFATTVDEMQLLKLKAELTIDEVDASKWLETEAVRVMFAVRDGDSAELKDVMLDGETTAAILKLYMKHTKTAQSFELTKLEKTAMDLKFDIDGAREAIKQAKRDGGGKTTRELMEQMAQLEIKATEAREAVAAKKKELKAA